MKNWIWGLMIAGSLAGGVRTWLYVHDADVAAGALLARNKTVLVERDAALAERDAALAAGDVLRGKLETAHAAFRDSAARLDAATKGEEERLATAGTILREALRKTLSPTDQAQLDSLAGTYEGRLAGADSSVRRASLATRNALGDLEACNRAGAELRVALEASRKLAGDWKTQAEAWERRARPGLFKRLVGLAPAFLAGGSVVALARGIGL